ncbi:iron-hydroxamate ABC transporter substrate-binding protein [Stutzerimonas stutzeri]|uniref:Iron-hydroxamate ABC transporter substrate-binding protein n=1 Tax=Stutzerimonas stutzeri TaxID=316 RepID=W8REJ6_STUST|nr:cobalamin-binding protein [Stutzerimonas stutzeri]AHL76922.1 iron-hydroxamate ABC transporter substrate-binding protein [Stutzerimonas stutzeri]MCQ4331835.1 cobalamin-binding protein [Stutzerimonas stutzeri]
MRALLLAVALLVSPLLAATERVISLAPSLSEIMLELDAVDLLVGVLDGGERPAALGGLPSVGRLGQLEMESLLALQPTLVLVRPDSISQAQREQLTQFGIPVLVAQPTSLAELSEQFALIGERVERSAQGRELERAFQQGLDRLRRRYHRERPLTVFYQIWNRPLYTLGGRQIISDAIEVCGGRNVFADLQLPAPQVSIESVLSRNPEVILAGSGAQLSEWKAWPRLAAVRKGQLWEVPDKGLERPSFQMLGAIGKLCEVMAGAER